MATQLRMHQAHRGDFLSILSDGSRAIVDTGTSACRDALARMLAKKPELLVITHLDADHFGGLHALLELGPSRKLPGLIWLNHFEADMATGALADAICGVDGASSASNDLADLLEADLHAAIEQGESWQERTRVTVEDGRLSPGGDTRADAVVDVDEQALAYLDVALDTEWKLANEATIDPEEMEAWLIIHELVHDLLPRGDLEEACMSSSVPCQSVCATKLPYCVGAPRSRNIASWNPTRESPPIRV